MATDPQTFLQLVAVAICSQIKLQIVWFAIILARAMSTALLVAKQIETMLINS